MRTHLLVMIAALSAVGVAGDIFLKMASKSDRLFLSPQFLLGAALYSSTAFGWVIALRHFNMATVGSVYSVATILLLALSGALLFGERLSVSEGLGILLAIASLVLLSRHG